MRVVLNDSFRVAVEVARGPKFVQAVVLTCNKQLHVTRFPVKVFDREWRERPLYDWDRVRRFFVNCVNRSGVGASDRVRQLLEI